MSDIFISYAREDVEEARRLAGALEARGWSVFWDRTILAGQNWRDVIDAALESASCIVVLWSKHSMRSRFVIQEADVGADRGHLVPACFDENIFETLENEKRLLPFGFRDIQIADLSAWEGNYEDTAIRQLFSAVARAIEAEKARRKEAEARQRAEVDARRRTKAEARRKVKEPRPHLAEAEANGKAEEGKIQQAEAEAERESEQRMRRQDEAGAERDAEDQSRQRAEETKRKAEEQRVHAETGPAGGRRNIVLLSDGTGNSPAKLNKTNVWRLYQALDLGDDDQIALYDDGVGTSGFRPLRLLGGAFGWGLSRNVRDLYEFLCRHYRDGDHVYIFGFSRGAFTARTLAALIARCGVLDCSKALPRRGDQEIQLNTRAGLKAGVKLAYKSYRRGYDHAPVARLTRWLRDLLLGPIPSPEAFRRDYGLAATIKFVGVWDTVDAVGLPVDELSTMIDRIFYPHRFPDQDFSPRVERACHAIAIDDERYTFHPVLWNERGAADSERITQVWFPGMHSDTGGGYPDNDLAHLSLQWMVDQVRFVPSRGDGLRFDLDSLRAIEHRAQPLGKVHDSRRGLGVYYRYKPRHVASLCDDRDDGVLIAEPKIHYSVFERIAENTTGYAPAGLPASYRVVDAQGAISELNPETYESAAQRLVRATLLERAQDHIFWRRVLYYMFVFVTLALVFMPYYRPPIRGAQPEGWLETLLTWAFGWIPAFLPGPLGSWASYWSDAWIQSASWFLVLAVFYGWLLGHSRAIDGNIHRLSEVAWWHVKRCPGAKPAIPGVGIFEKVAGRWRNARKLQRFHRLSVRVAVPVLAVAVAAYLALGTLYRVAYHLPGVGDGVCGKWFDALGADGEESRRWQPGLWRKEIRFDTRTPCIDTGVSLRAGQRYVIEVEVQEDWTDGKHAAAVRGISGFGHLLNPAFVAGVPSRRSLLLPWFSLTGEIGRDSGYTFPLNRERVVITPSQSGRLHLYVNDAINALGMERAFDPQAIDSFPIAPEERQTGRSAAWYAHYLDNAGTATVTVTRDR